MANFNVKEGLSIQGTEIVDENRVVRNATLNAANSVTFQNIPNTGLVNDGLTVNGYDIDLGGSQTLDTDDIQESGTPTNIYFTTARARATLSVNQPSGDGTLAYNDGTGVFTYTGPSAAETRVHFSATTSTGATYDSNTGVFALANIPNTAITNSSITINGIATSLGAARTLNTDDVQEDPSPTNKYFTEARTRAAVSVTPNTGLSYDSGTGVFELASIPNSSLTYPYFTINNTQVQLGQSVGFPNQFTDDVIEDANPTNLYFTPARARAEFSGGTGVTYDEPTGEFSIGQAVATSDSPTFAGLSVNGNLTVTGTTTTLNTETIQLADNTIVLNSNATGSATEDGGIEIERGDDTNKTFIWDETNDKWTIGSETFVASTVEANLTGNVTGTVSSIANHDTDALTEGSTNVYYTSARFDTDLATKTTDNLTEGSTNVYYTSARFDTDLATKDTADLAEGTNLYYTNARADARVNLQTGTNLDLSQKTTADLTEGANLYYTDVRADARIAAASVTDLSDVDQAVATTDSPSFVQLTSTIATGTAPFVVASTTKVVNLNADFLDGMSTHSSAQASSIVARDASGDFAANVITAGGITLGDNDELKLGDGNDLKILHNGSNSIINDEGVGDLYLGGNSSVNITNAALSEFKAKFITDGAVELYHDNDKKFETTATGATITGVLVATSLTGNVTGQVSDISNHDTDALSEGATNLYFTDARAQTALTTQLAAKQDTIVAGDYSNTTVTTTTGTEVDFTISAGRSVNDVLVFVDGVLKLPTTDYTISGTTLTFGVAPGNGVVVHIRYLPLG